jgi:hypothetical protein
MSRHALIIGSLNAVVLAILVFVAIFTSVHVTIALVAVGILVDHLLNVVGVLLFKSIEILGKKYERRRRQHNRQHSSPWTLAYEAALTPGAETEKNLPDELGPSEGLPTVNSSETAVKEEAPLDIGLCRSAAAKEIHRFPGLLQSLGMSFGA